jgi:hypothetical protein
MLLAMSIRNKASKYGLAYIFTSKNRPIFIFYTFGIIVDIFIQISEIRIDCEIDRQN